MNFESTNKTVSLRLPPRVAEMLDQEVARRNTNASEVIRRAIVLMNRMRDGVFVPLRVEQRALLEGISEKKELPAEEILTDWISTAIKNENAGKTSLKLRVMATPSQFFDSKADNDRVWEAGPPVANHVR